jgi:hypothetical protein
LKIVGTYPNIYCLGHQAKPLCHPDPSLPSAYCFGHCWLRSTTSDIQTSQRENFVCSLILAPLLFRNILKQGLSPTFLEKSLTTFHIRTTGNHVSLNPAMQVGRCDDDTTVPTIQILANSCPPPPTCGTPSSPRHLEFRPLRHECDQIVTGFTRSQRRSPPMLPSSEAGGNCCWFFPQSTFITRDVQTDLDMKLPE